MASAQKKAQRLKRPIVFIDESGLLLAPLVRRTWAPRGCTPVLAQRGRAREKVSIIAALTVSPQQRAVRLYFALHPNANVTLPAFRAFLRGLRRHLGRPFFLVWDRLPGHRARAITALLDRLRVRAVLLPPYAPELNPVELLWAYLKQNPLANLAAPNARTLAQQARGYARTLQHRPHVLRGCLRGTPLFFCRR